VGYKEWESGLGAHRRDVRELDGLFCRHLFASASGGRGQGKENGLEEHLVAGALDIPDRLVGARIVLRPFEAGDVPALRAAIAESRQHLRRWMPWADGHETAEETETFVEAQRAGWAGRTGFGCGIFLRADGRVLGGSGLHVLDWAARRFEIGYWLRVGATGRGYVREAVAVLSCFAFDTLGANRVVIRCDADNDRSRRVAEASGYTLEGRHRRDSLRPTGGLRDTLMFAMVREEYEAARPGWRGLLDG
jgi:ribosomal-protein-serine acetyltransferase